MWQTGEELKKRRIKEKLLQERAFKYVYTEGAFLPTVGVLPALSEALEDKEEELSARARGAVGVGLDALGGLNGLTCVKGIQINAF